MLKQKSDLKHLLKHAKTSEPNIDKLLQRLIVESVTVKSIFLSLI